MNLLSDELMDLELRLFLEGEKVTEEIKQEVYYPEIVRRGYRYSQSGRIILERKKLINSSISSIPTTNNRELR